MKLRVGFVGLGRMGAPMVNNLVRAGYPVAVYNRTAEKLDQALALGAVRADTPAAAAADADVVISIVTDTEAATEVLLGSRGVITSVRPGSVVIDMSTISPSAARHMARAFAQARVSMLDAPVSGGVQGAERGDLVIMVGGPEQSLERCRPVLEVLGRKIVHLGDSGSGQLAKLCNQAACSLTILSVAEALVLGQRAGLDPNTLLEAMSGGAAGSWSMANLGPKMVSGSFAPGFTVGLHRKDLQLVLAEARALAVSMPGTALADTLFREVEERCQGKGLGNQALILALSRAANDDQDGVGQDAGEEQRC